MKLPGGQLAAAGCRSDFGFKVKNLANPAATGFAGPAFETKVAAAFLTLLLTRGAPLCLGTGTLKSVHLQAGHIGTGWSTDDLLLEATSVTGESIKAALQVKRAFSISTKDSESVQTFQRALADFRNSAQFHQDRDVVALVTSSLSAKLVRGLTTLLDCARASLNAKDMARRLAIPGYLGKAPLEYHKTIVAILADASGGSPSEEEVWRFLRRFRVVDLDLNVEGGFTETMLRSLLAATLPDSDSGAVDATWNKLITLALGDAGSATSYTRETLPSDLLQRHQRPTGFAHGIERLLEDSAVVVEGIRTTIGEKIEIPRRELLGELFRLIEESPLVFVTGAAGSGKSALVKSAFAIATQGGAGFAFRAVSLAGYHINDVLSARGLSLRNLQAQTALHTKKVLWVDSLERLMEKPAEQRAAFLDLLRELKLDPTWRLVVTCRDYSAETVRTAFFGEVGLTPADLDVEELNDAELDEVVTDFPALERPLNNTSLRSLLRNPFFLDMAAKMNWPVTESLPATERAFREKVWKEVVRRVDEDLEIGLPNLRADVLVQIALRRAKGLEPFVGGKDLDARPLARLVRDGLLQVPSPGSDLYAPTHDVFEDWALMRWLEESFGRHGRKLDSLLDELGTHPALRRAYRRWLTESLDVDPQSTDALVVALVQNPNVSMHWRDDTLVGVLQSRDARGFIDRNVSLLLDDDAALLREVIHVLRVACRSAVPRRLFGVDATGEIFLPKGNGWIGAGQLMENALPNFTDADLLLIVGFLEDWTLLTKYGIRYPIGARSIANVAWHWVSRIPWRSGVRDAEERLLRVILAIPIVAEPKLSEVVESLLTEGRQSRFDDALSKLLFSHFACDAVVRDLPDLAFRVAEHLLGLDRTLEEVVADRSDYETEALNHAFGFGRRFSMDDYPPSAFNGPYLRMFWHHPGRALDFTVSLVNRACEAYAHPDNQYRYIESPGRITLLLDDGPHEQYVNWRLWSAYRAMHVAPHCFESALMALEYWLLEKAKRGDADLEPVLLDLLRRSNNAALTGVIASVAAADPGKAGEAAFALLTCPPLLRADLRRSSQEPFLTAQLGAFGLSGISAEKSLYEKERKESGLLEHRSRNLEYVAVILQMVEKFRDRVWELIDGYKKKLPAEADQNEETKLWRLQLHRIDTRNFVETGRTAEGHIVLGATDPEPDLQALVEQQRPRSEAFDAAISLLNWGRATFERKTASDDWRNQIVKAQAQLARTSAKRDEAQEREVASGGPAYVAAVCIRDHWTEMSTDEQEWSALTVCDAVAADADITDHFAIVGRNPMEGSRAGAFALSALFDKKLSPTAQARLLPTLAKAVMHAVEETVSYAMHGVAQFLWKSDRGLALTCLQALVTKAVEHNAFIERRRRRPLLEQAGADDDSSDTTFDADLRSRMREFVANREPANETQIAALDLSRWPGRSVAPHFFAVATQNPIDPFARQVMQQCATALPKMWAANRQSRRTMSRGHGEERFDPHIEHEFVDAVCRFAVQLEPEEAHELLNPIFLAATQFPEQASDIVTWLILYQGDRAPAPTLWFLWQRFADDFAAHADPEEVDDEHSDEGKMLHELFLGGNWAEQRDWPPLRGETQRLRNFFTRLPPMKRSFDCYAYYLAKAGSPTLPDSLEDVAGKLDQSSYLLLSESAMYYLEEILTRLIYGGNSRIRTEAPLRIATLKILDGLVAVGSSPAYKLRDDFLTPTVVAADN